jgi:hypothetical protein
MKPCWVAALTNYLQTSNPYALPGPPTWWKLALREFDPALVVFPSVMRRVYILARRRGFTTRRVMQPLVKLNNELIKMTAYGDGDVMAAHNLVYVDQIIGWGIWTNAIFNQLRARDTWRVGGGEAYANLLDEQDEAERQKLRRTIQSDMEHRAVDSWRSLQARTGQRTKLTIPSARNLTSSSTVGSGFTS